MTCFWDGIIQGLWKHRLKLPLPHPANWTPETTIVYLKSQNQETTDVLFNGEELSAKERTANFQYIQNFDYEQIAHGYLCSAADPFLLLVVQLVRLPIEYNFNRTLIHVTPVQKHHRRTPTLEQPLSSK